MILIINKQGLGNNVRLLPVIFSKFKNEKIIIVFSNKASYELCNSLFNQSNILIELVKNTSLFKFFYYFKFLNIRINQLFITDYFSFKYLLFSIIISPKKIFALKKDNKFSFLKKLSLIDYDFNIYEQQIWSKLFNHHKINNLLKVKNFKKVNLTKNIIKNQKYALMFPGSDVNSPFLKRWPIDNYIVLSNLIKKKFNIPVFFCGNKDERNISIYLDKFEYLKDKNLIEKLDIKELISLIQNSYFCVGNDTGPIHIANLLEIDLICLFCEDTAKPKNIPVNKNFQFIKSKNIKDIKVTQVFEKLQIIKK